MRVMDMTKKVESYKTRIDRICNKVQRMVDDIELQKSQQAATSKNKSSLKNMINDILMDDEVADC